MSQRKVRRFGMGVAASLAALAECRAEPAHAAFYSTDTQGTYNTGSAVTTSNTFDLSGDGSAYVTITADTTDDIAVSVPSGYLDASLIAGLFFIQPSTTLPGPTDALMSGTGGPYYITDSTADLGYPVTAFPFGAVEYVAVPFSDNGQAYTGYIQGTLDNAIGYLEFSVSDYGSDDPAAGPPALPATQSGTQSAPEPASVALFAVGTLGLGALRRRRTSRFMPRRGA